MEIACGVPLRHRFADVRGETVRAHTWSCTVRASSDGRPRDPGAVHGSSSGLGMRTYLVRRGWGHPNRICSRRKGSLRSSSALRRSERRTEEEQRTTSTTNRQRRASTQRVTARERKRG
eukprot:3438465-Prymnesium_polylepis.1